MNKLLINCVRFATAVAVLLASVTANAGNDKDKKEENKKEENKKDENKKDEKKNTSDNYTVVKSGASGDGSPTYSTGGLNPNPPKPKKEKSPKKKK